MPRRLFHYLCIFLLLVAQQGALAHATWHAGGDAHVHDGHAHDHDNANERDNHHETPSGQSSLCAFDLAFGQVLGGVHGSCAPGSAAELLAAVSTYIFNPRLGTEAVPAHSRGPPTLL